MQAPALDHKQEACRTYIEQTKLLVTLASAFIFAPAALVATVKEKTGVEILSAHLFWFLAAEIFFVASVLAGYVTLGSIAGSQDKGEFDVFRPATRIVSFLQFVFYVAGISTFVYLVVRLAG